MNRAEQRIVKAVGGNLRAERSRVGLTQEEVAQRAGMHTTQVARMERGETDSGVSKFVQLAWAIEVPPTALFHGLDAP